jgi:hypothetical protein
MDTPACLRWLARCTLYECEAAQAVPYKEHFSNPPMIGFGTFYRTDHRAPGAESVALPPDVPKPALYSLIAFGSALVAS